MMKFTKWIKFTLFSLGFDIEFDLEVDLLMNITFRVEHFTGFNAQLFS